MYTNAEPKKEIKDSHSMLLPKLVSELMAMRKQLPAPRKKSHLLEFQLFTNFMRREWDMNSHTAHSRFMGLGAVETVSRVWTDRLLARCHKKPNLLAVPTAPLLRQTDNSFTLGEECHFGNQPAFSQRANPNALRVQTGPFPHTLAKANNPLQTCSSWFSAMDHITVNWDPYDKGWYRCQSASADSAMMSM